jgi:hypothetical protein
MLSFNNITISKAEDEHSQLKRALKSSVEDFKKMIKVIELMLKNQKAEYLIAHEEAKTRVFKKCAIFDLKNLRIYISSYALRLIRKQLDKLNKAKDSNTSFALCIRVYETSMKLSCVHVIERRKNNSKLLQLEDVHSY